MQADPRSPEHGQYGFLQDLVRHVAYETLSKRERRTKHLAAAEYLLRAMAAEESEVVEVIASHYLDAYRRGARRRGRGRDQAQGLRHARPCRRRGPRRWRGRRGARHFEDAVALTDDQLEQADLLGRAATGGPRGRPRRLLAAPGAINRAVRGRGRHARGGPGHGAVGHCPRLHRPPGRAPRTAGARLRRDRRRRARRGSRRARGATSRPTGSPATSNGQARGPSSRWTSPRRTGCRALTLALRAKSATLESRGHTQEAFALLKHALDVALKHDLLEDASTCYFILSDGCFRARPLRGRAGLPRRGARSLPQDREPPVRVGDARRADVPAADDGGWDEALATANEFTQEQVDSGASR